MSHAIESYELAYEADDSEVPNLVRAAFSADAVFESAYLTTPVAGRDALVEHIRATRERIEGVTSRRTSSLERVGNSIRWTWVFESEGEVVAEGMDFAVLDSRDLIERLVVFDGLAPRDGG